MVADENLGIRWQRVDGETQESPSSYQCNLTSIKEHVEFSIHHPRKKNTQKLSSRDADTPECYASPTIQMMIEDTDTQTQTIYLLFIFLP